MESKFPLESSPMTAVIPEQTESICSPNLLVDAQNTSTARLEQKYTGKVLILFYFILFALCSPFAVNWTQAHICTFMDQMNPPPIYLFFVIFLMFA
jgi:hypothetical protein